MIGQTLLHFEITAKLGEGGMGEVYRARDTKLGREVAIKVLPKPFAQEPERLARFEREARVLAGLNHPNIAAIHQVEEANGTHFLVMELLRGEDLAESLSRGPLTIDEALRIATQVTAALDAAHEQGVVHRDLKPANVFLTSGREVKILDFGLAKALDFDAPDLDLSNSPTLTAGVTELGSVLGTAGYMSPEQTRGESVDKRADIWAFGCLLFEMLSGRQPFEGSTRADRMAAILQTEPDWSLLPDSTPDSVRHLLRRCLEKDARSRIRDMGDVAYALNHPADDDPFTPPQRPTRRRWTTIGSMLAFAFALGYLAAVALHRREVSTPAPSVSTRFSISLPDEQLLQATDHPEASLAISGDGRRIAWVGGQSSFDSRLFVRDMEDLEARVVANSESARQPFFSPDGEWLAFFNRLGELKKSSLITGETLTILQDIPGSTWAFGGWGDDGRILFSTWGSSGLNRVSAEGGEFETLTAGQKEWPLTVEVLPGSRWAVYTLLGEHGSKIVRRQLDTAEESLLLDNASNPRYLASGHLLFSRDGIPMTTQVDGDPPRIVGPATPLGESTRVDNPSLASAVPILDASDDGTLVYAPGVADLWQARLVWVDRTGSVLGSAADALQVPAISFLRLSPDEQEVVVSYKKGRQAMVDVVDLERNISTPVFRADSIISVQPLWMPGGENLAVATCGTERGTILKIRADGEGTPEELFSVPTLFGVVPWSVSSDGAEIAYTVWEQESGGNNGRFHRTSGQSAEPFYLRSDAFEMQVQFSPDGRWVAYASDESGTFEVYIREHPAGGQKHRVSESGGIAPIWSGNGRELFFQSADGRRLMVADVQPGHELRVGKPELLFEGPFRRSFDVGHSYDVAADGQRFLMMQVTEDLETVRQLVVVQGWHPRSGLLDTGGSK